MEAQRSTEIGGTRTEVVSRPISGTATTAFRLAGWVIRPAFFRVEGPQGRYTIEPRCMHVLVSLAERAGEVVCRSELMDVVWSDVTVGEEVLTRAVSQLRQVLGDDPKSPRFIETIRGGGYRLVAPVESVAPDEVAKNEVEPDRRISPAGWFSAVVGVLAVVVAFAVLGSRTVEPDGANGGFGYHEGAPVTTAPGQELFPAVSPSGSMIVFSAGVGERCGLYLTQADADRWVRLTESPGSDVYPRWAANGSQIVFARREGENTSLCTVAALGGPVRCSAALPGPVYGLDWTPSADGVVLCSSSLAERIVPLRVMDLESGELREVTQPDPEHFTGDSQPRFCPDGRRLAFVRCDHAGVQDLWVKTWPEGEPRRVTHGLGSILGLTWARDGESLVVAAAPDGRRRLWRVDVDSGDWSVIPTPDSQAIHPAVDPATGAVVYVSRRVNDSIWHLEIGDDGETAIQAVAESSRRDGAPSWSPDGLRTAFASDRSGTWQIWIAQIGTREATQITELDLGQPGRPYFSPDGERLAFSVLEASTERLMVFDLQSGRARRLPSVGRHDIVLGWSGDGRVVARSERGEHWSLVQVDPVDGDVEYLELQWREDCRPRVAAGRLYYVPTDSEGLWMFRFGEKRAEQVVASELFGSWTSWAPSQRHILFVERGAGLTVNTYDLQTKTVDRDVFDLPDSIVSITPSPDCTGLLAVRRMLRESDLVAVADLG